MSSNRFQHLKAEAEEGQPPAQFLLSQICAQNKDTRGMIFWLQKASANGFTDALSALGHCYEKGHGVPRDFDKAMEHYDKALLADSTRAAYHKAELIYKSGEGPANQALVRDLLIRAAKADFVPALRVIGFLAIQKASSRSLGLACLRRAAHCGDPVSSFNLSWALLQQGFDDNTKQEASHWLKQALAGAYPLLEPLQAQLECVDAVSPEPAPLESIDFEVPFSLYPEVKHADHQQVNKDPAIAVFEDVLNIVDCAYLIYLSRPYLTRANVIDPGSQDRGMVSDVRTSMSTYLPFGIVDIISRYIELRIICETGEDLACSEPMSILYYSLGEYYRPHVDYFDPKLKVSEALLKDGGQRTVSAITYLTAPLAGGGTSFPRLNLTVPASNGSTLWFRNCFDDGRVDDRSLHAGDPVKRGEKWVVTKWFRERPTRYLEF